MDKLPLDANLFTATIDDWIKSIPMDLECYTKELYNQIKIKPLYESNQSNLLASIKEIKEIELMIEDEGNKYVLSSKAFHQKGANPIQEIAYTLAYISDVLHTKSEEEAIQFVKYLQLEVFVDTDFFGTIAKLKAFRIVLPTLLKEFHSEYNMDDGIQINAVTSTKTITKEEPQLNLIRKTIEVIAAIIGNANFIEIIPFEDSEDAIRWSNNIYHLLVHESKMNEFRNVVNGSYYLEELTKEIAVLAWDHFLQIETSGGYQEYLNSGELDKELAIERELLIEKMMIGDYKLVGLNSFRRQDPDTTNNEIQQNSNQSEELFYFSEWIEKCHYLAKLSWDCLILEGASEQEEELMKNVLYSLHSIGLKNKMDAQILFIAGDEKRINQFAVQNPEISLIRVVEEVNEEYEFSMSSLSHLPNLISELKKIEVEK